jgi:uncharacterized repeat protein (TIGR01451 family)
LTITGASTVRPGTRLTYTITVSNTGPSTATGISVASSVPAGLVFAANTGDCTTAFPCSLAAIDPGQQRSIDVSVCVPHNFVTNPVNFSATVTSNADSNAANDSFALMRALDTDVLFIDGFELCP